MRRVSIKGLLLLVATVGVGIAALREANAIWEAVGFTGALGWIVVEAIRCPCLRGERRARAFGFAVAGGVYFVVACVPPAPGSIRTLLLTSRAIEAGRLWLIGPQAPGSTGLTGADHAELIAQLERTHSQLLKLGADPGDPAMRDLARSRDRVSQLGQPGGGPRWTPTAMPMLPGAATAQPFTSIAHDLLALVAGSLGGVLAARAYAGSHAENPSDSAL